MRLASVPGMHRRHHSTTARLLPTAAATAIALGVAACGTATGFDVPALEADLEAALGPAYHADGVTLFEVDCPHDAVDAVAGDVLACIADVERRFVRIRVEIRSPQAWDFTTLDVVHDLDATEASVATEMGTTLGDRIQLDCGSPRLQVLPVGTSLRCRATDSGGNVADVLLTANGPGQTAWEVLG